MSLSRIRIGFALTATVFAIVSMTTSVSAHAPEPARMGTRLATQQQLRTAFPAASSKDLKDLGKVVVSRYAKCDYPSWYGEELTVRSIFSGGTAIGASKWHIRHCWVNYEGEDLACLVLYKDELGRAQFADFVKQYNRKVCGYSLRIRRFVSKPGYFSTEKQPVIKMNDIPEYFGHSQGAWSVNTSTGEHCYSGPYQLFVVPDGQFAVVAYGANWTTNNVVGANEFCVKPTPAYFGITIFGSHKFAN